MSSAHTFVLGLCALAVSIPVTSAAQDERPIRIVFHWERDETSTSAECPSPEALIGAVQARVGTVIFVDEEREADVRARGTLRAFETEWVASFALEARNVRDVGAFHPLDMHDESTRPHATPTETHEAALELAPPSYTQLGVREIRIRRGPSCASLVETLGLVVSLMVDLARVRLEETGDPGETTSRSPPPSESQSVSQPSTPPQPRLEPPWTVDARAAAVGVFFGLLPSSAVGPALELGLGSPWPLRFEASGTLLLGARVEQAGQGASFLAWFAGVSACPQINLAPVMLSGCVGADLGQMIATGFGYDRNLEAQQLLVLVHAEVRVEVRMGPATVELGALLMTPLIRDEFAFLDGGSPEVIFRPEPVAFGLRLGVGVGSW